MIDLLVLGAAEVVTVAGEGPKRGAEQAELGVIQNGAVAVARGRIKLVGRSDDICRAVESETVAKVVDARGKIVLPGFVDAHTHLVFAGTREDEYERRLQGVSYLEIASAGGGINRTVRETRAASHDQLLRLARKHAVAMLRHGTTTIEAKSGYGLSVTDELKCLAVLRQLGEEGPASVVPTFLGAHAVPPEYFDRAGEYVALVTDEMLPAVAAGGWAEFCDVFCDVGAFTLEQSRLILSRARELGLGLKVHADEFASLGAAELAVELGATSADHLVASRPDTIAALARGNVLAVLLPATTFHLGHNQYAPARDFVSAGVPVAIATDFNPGSSFTESMPMAIAIGCSQMKLTPAEAVVAATLNAACAVNRGDQVGSIEPGKAADLIVLDMPNYRHLAYHFGLNPVEKVIKGGRVLDLDRLGVKHPE